MNIKIISFYSFKSIGCTTAIAFTAKHLAKKGKRVAVIDFNLESPNINSLLKLKTSEHKGVVDYLYERINYNSHQYSTKINDICYRCHTSQNISVIPTGDINEHYINRVAELDRGMIASFYKRDFNPIKALINDVKQLIKPDVILIDTNSGINDLSSITINDLSDIVYINLFPNDIHFKGLSILLEAIKRCKFNSNKKSPVINFILLPLPYMQKKKLLKKVEKWFQKNNIKDFSDIYAVDYNYEIILSGINIHESMYTDYEIIANSI
ncbi:MAG: AAA family ATPase [Trichodesmium sp. St18_bin1]|nr:AAA family ATPase [Trichodesmium sp. St18_bin1]